MLPAQNNRHLPADRPLFFDDFITQDSWNAAQNMPPALPVLLPALNVFETADALVIELAVPGVPLDDIRFFTTDRSLELRYEPDNRLFEPFGSRRLWATGYQPKAFRQVFELNPQAVDFDGMQVSAVDGIVHIEFPKRENLRGPLLLPPIFSLN